MENTTIDTHTFTTKYQRMPEADLTALWEFRVGDGRVNVWGRWPEAKSMIALYIRMNDMHGEPVSLLDFAPLPKVFAVENLEH